MNVGASRRFSHLLCEVTMLCYITASSTSRADCDLYCEQSDWSWYGNLSFKLTCDTFELKCAGEIQVFVIVVCLMFLPVVKAVK